MSIRNDWPSELSAQAVFNHVVEHLLAQQKPCRTKMGACAYRGDDTESACAVGALLTDEEAAAITAKGANTGQGVGVLKLRGLLPARLAPHTSLLSRLQAIHDTESTRPLIKLGLEWLENVAITMQLEIPPALEEALSK